MDVNNAGFKILKNSDCKRFMEEGNVSDTSVRALGFTQRVVLSYSKHSTFVCSTPHGTFNLSSDSFVFLSTF